MPARFSVKGMSAFYEAAKQGSTGRPDLHGQMPGLQEARLWAEKDVNMMKTVIYWVGMAFLQAPRAAIGWGTAVARYSPERPALEFRSLEF